MQEDLEKQLIFDAKKREYEMMKEKFREARNFLFKSRKIAIGSEKRRSYHFGLLSPLEG